MELIFKIKITWQLPLSGLDTAGKHGRMDSAYVPHPGGQPMVHEQRIAASDGGTLDPGHKDQ